MAGGGRVFGQSMRKKKGGGSTNYQRQFGNGKHSKRDEEKSEEEALAERRAQYKRKIKLEGEEIDIKFGYERFDYKAEDKSRRGWVFNMLPTVRFVMHVCAFLSSNC